MIFWFRAKDGILSLVFLVIWVLSVAALSMILFNEGVSFSETGRASSQVILETRPDTLYIITGKKIQDLPVRKEFSLPHNDYTVFMSDSTKGLFIRPELRLNITPDNLTKIEIMKHSSGRSRTEAVKKAESLIYNYRISNDTLYLDQYFALPSGSKWSGDEVTINLCLPENTVLYFDNSSENLFHDRLRIGIIGNDSVMESYYDFETEPWQLGGKFWTISPEGLKKAEKVPSKQK